MKFSVVVSSHMNPHLSGVAKFNRILADYLGVECVGIRDLKQIKDGPALVSIKVSDSIKEKEQLEQLHVYLKEHKISYYLFFHSFDSLDIENKLISGCSGIFCGNSKIMDMLRACDVPVYLAFCPPLVDENSEIEEAELNIFSFGMAHKIQVEYYKRLKSILDLSKYDYLIWVSTAFHEKARFGDFASIATDLKSIFGTRIQFLGFLSDAAVNYFLSRSDLFVAFFREAVRANNTSVFAAMNKGCAVLTNCDKFSPKWMKHNENILNIREMESFNLTKRQLKKIGKEGQKCMNSYASWNALCNFLEAL